MNKSQGIITTATITYRKMNGQLNPMIGGAIVAKPHKSFCPSTTAVVVK